MSPFKSPSASASASTASSTFPFRIVEHKIPGQHLREYPGALLGPQEAVVHLSVKQYIPKDNPAPKPGDVTIIGAHANAFPKELYEPLWEDLHARAKSHSFRIRSIWIADVAWQGQSSVLNEDLIGNDPSWHDHVRDLLHIVNVKRDEMPRPIVGIGHSMGGNNLVNLSLIHPRLFTTLILIDPVISEFSSTPPDAGNPPALVSNFRRDVWPSRSAAASSFSKSKFYERWDPRVLQRWIEHGLRELPTAIHPAAPGESANNSSSSSSSSSSSNNDPPVTLKTTKHQEVFTFLRENYAGYGVDGKEIDRSTHADLDPSSKTLAPFYRPESPATLLRLPAVRPSVLYILGGKSEMSMPHMISQKMTLTGSGVGGSGGARLGRVQNVMVERAGHLVAMEAVEETAEASAQWLQAELRRSADAEAQWRRQWEAKSTRERQMVDQQWLDAVGEDPRLAAKKRTEGAKL